MSATLSRRRVSRRERVLGVLRLLAVAALVCQFLFAHGCHGDEDNELFTAVAAR